MILEFHLNMCVGIWILTEETEKIVVKGTRLCWLTFKFVWEFWKVCGET